MTNPLDLENNFYLGFNKKTGELIDVIPPKGRELRLDPKDFHLFSLGKLESCRQEQTDDCKQEPRSTFLKELNQFNELIKINALPSMKLTFLDLEHGSVCGGSCGPIPFRFC